MMLRRTSLIAALLAVCASAMPLRAFAQQFEGPYITVGGGWSFSRSETGTAITLPGRFQSGNDTHDVNAGNGATGELSAGWAFPYGIRAEVEGNFLHDRISSLSGLPSGAGAAGSEKQYGAFINGLYDFNVGSFVSPYIGAGVGYQTQSWTNFSVKSANGTATGGAGSGGGFAYQGIAGLAFPIRPVPGLAVTAEYRFIERTGTVSAITSNNFSVGSATDHSIMLGLRYAFNADTAANIEPGVVEPPQAVESVAPAPAASRMYIVYFAWNRADLTDRAHKIIAEAASAAATGTTQIAVSGHTDASGTNSYNQALSLRRARVVAGELVRLGVPRDEISVQALGDNDPAVDTATGVRNAQNRRVEIVLQ